MKNVLAILPKSIGGRLTTSSIIDGFKKNNFFVYVFDELKDEKFPFSENFDFIVGYDFSPVKIKIDNKLNMPCIAYFSDDINKKTSGEGFCEYKKYLRREDIFVFYWDRGLFEEEKEVKNLFYMPHFVNCEIYDNFSTPKNDVLFAGRLDTDLRLHFFLELNKRLPNRTFEWFAIERHYKDAISRCKNEEERHIINTSYKGFIDNEIDMVKAINNSKIVYNINSQGLTSLNYRTFQTLASKRLVISDVREELDLFENIIPTYKNLDDLCSKIEFYLNNPDEYNKITQKTYKITRLNHNSKFAVQDMVSKISANL